MRPSSNRIDKGLWWDRAWYLVHGCRPRSPACLHCWSARAANMRQHNPHPAVAKRHEGIVTDGHFNGHINLDEEALAKPLQVRKPQVWAIWDDLFYGDDADREWCERHGVPFQPVPIEFIYKAFAVMALCPQHVFVVLTKRARRMYDVIMDPFFIAEVDGIYRANALRHGLPVGDLRFPSPNVVGMVTTENQDTADERIRWLLATRFHTRGVSVEPMLSFVSLYPHFSQYDYRPTFDFYPPAIRGDGKPIKLVNGLDWVAAGCESGAHRRATDLNWLRVLSIQCYDAGIPFFLKQAEIDGRVVKMPSIDGNRWDQFPEVFDVCPQ